jgi:hypothetical protein
MNNYLKEMKIDDDERQIGRYKIEKPMIWSTRNNNFIIVNYFPNYYIR